MKYLILTLLLSAQAITSLGEVFSDDRYYNVRIDADIKSEQTVDGEIVIKTLSSPHLTTLASGIESKIRTTCKFTTEVPGYAEKTEQCGESGIILSVTPVTKDSYILIKGILQVLKAPATSSLDEIGAVAVQEAYNIQFSLKLKNDNLFELKPIEMPDGSKILLSFKAKVIGNGTNKEEMRKRALEAEKKGKTNLFGEPID